MVKNNFCSKKNFLLKNFLKKNLPPPPQTENFKNIHKM